MTKLVILGARVDGQAGVVLDIIQEFGLFEVIGFLDDIQKQAVKGIPVIGGLDMVAELVGQASFFIATGNNKLREGWYNLIKSHQGDIVNIIHPTAVISKSAFMGNGIFVGPKVVLTHNVRVGNGVLINTAASIDHDNILEDFSNVSPGCHTSGRVKIRQGAFLGTGVKVIPDIEIGIGAIVGSGAVVIRNVLAGQIVVGVPAEVKNERN